MGCKLLHSWLRWLLKYPIFIDHAEEVDRNYDWLFSQICSMKILSSSCRWTVMNNSRLRTEFFSFQLKYWNICSHFAPSCLKSQSQNERWVLCVMVQWFYFMLYFKIYHKLSTYQVWRGRCIIDLLVIVPQLTSYVWFVWINQMVLHTYHKLLIIMILSRRRQIMTVLCSYVICECMSDVK